MMQEQVIDTSQTYASVTDKISTVVLTRRIRPGWLLLLSFAFLLVSLLLIAVSYLLARGVGIWGVNVPVAWGFAITNFVWWIGIGHAGTLISAFLLLLHQEWRTSINRFAEAMTLFAVACAGLFPLLHLGRPWFFYWMVPYPNSMDLWPQFRSPLIWDFFAVSTYFTVSFLFWFVGLIPDLATLREKATNKFARLFYGLLALGWRGSAAHWERYEMAYLLLAGIATPLVVSVHTVVSLDFAVAIVPGWHSTIFPPYFVAGAIFSGFAMVMTLALPLRRIYGLEGLITKKHLNVMAKLMLATGLMVDYGYMMELFLSGFYSGERVELQSQLDRAFGGYAYVFWIVIACNVCVTQLLWFRVFRQNEILLFIVSILINVGMWAERFMIVVQSLSHDYMPSRWRMYSPTIWDWATYLGTIGLFLLLFLLFIRVLPMISMAEVRKLLHEKRHEPDASTPGGPTA
jgi:Ni/Fe-hydrogenase subunit HybB-like protein